MSAKPIAVREARLSGPRALFTATAVMGVLWAGIIGTEGAFAQDGIFKFSAGVDYSTGDYGLDDDTKIGYVPFTFKHDAFP